jgi:pSer/pThr/pTyr-binding forkhead associated (FHA) protein
VPTLVALFGSRRGLRFLLEGTCIVGRSSTAGIQLLDVKVSREHCRFTVEEGGVFVEDLGSHNRTFVNGSAIDGRSQIGAGDEVAVGDSLFVLDPGFDVVVSRYDEATAALSDAPASAERDERPGRPVPGPPHAAKAGDLELFADLTAALGGAADA